MRTAWKGTFQFGLLAIPVRLGTSMDTRASMFHQAHKDCSTQIKQKRWCETCQVEVAYADIAKGVKLADETLSLITDDELDELRVWNNKTIQLVHFAQADEIDVKLRDQTYYLEPVDGGGPAHALLLAAMQQAEGLAAVCTVGYRDRVSLAVMVIEDGHFEVTTLRWPSELRPAEVNLPPVPALRPQEVKMAERFIRSLTRPFDPAEHVDTYQQALVGLVAQKAEGTGQVSVRRADPAKPYEDMMALLEKSIAETKAVAKPARRRTAKAS